MPGPQSPRGRKAKGDAGEREVKRLAEKAGFRVVDGRMTLPGADLVINAPEVWEVKNRPWRTLGGSKRAELHAAASMWRRLGYIHRTIWHEAEGWVIAEILRNGEGRIGLVYKEPFEAFLARVGGQEPGVGAPLAPTATRGAESGAVSTATELPAKPAAPPEKPSADRGREADAAFIGMPGFRVWREAYGEIDPNDGD